MWTGIKFSFRRIRLLDENQIALQEPTNFPNSARILLLHQNHVRHHQWLPQYWSVFESTRTWNVWNIYLEYSNLQREEWSTVLSLADAWPSLFSSSARFLCSNLGFRSVIESREITLGQGFHANPTKKSNKFIWDLKRRKLMKEKRLRHFYFKFKKV